MVFTRLGGVCAAIGLALGLGACTDGYGYGGLDAGYGAAYGGPFDDGFGYGGYGYGPSNFGWYGDYYYPGTGIYVYDQYRRPFRWNNAQRRYWNGQQRYRGRDWNGQGRWNGFDRGIGQGYRGNGGQWQQQPGGDRGRWQRGTDGGRQWRPGGAATPGVPGYRGDRGGQRFRDGGGQQTRGNPGSRGGGNPGYTAPSRNPDGGRGGYGRQGRVAPSN